MGRTVTLLSLMFMFSTAVSAQQGPSTKEIINSIGLYEFKCFYHVENLPKTLRGETIIFAENEKDAMKLLLVKIRAFSSGTPIVYIKNSDNTSSGVIDDLSCKPYGSQ